MFLLLFGIPKDLVSIDLSKFSEVPQRAHAQNFSGARQHDKNKNYGNCPDWLTLKMFLLVLN